MDAPYAILEPLRPGIARLLARNPSPFTYTGTQTYLVGDDDAVIVVDPGPDMDEHVEAIVEAVGQRELVAISCTHTHRDHSPASRPLKERTGAPIIGCAPLALSDDGPRADAAFDRDYAPDRILEEDEELQAGSVTMRALATPGHTSNHLCFAVGDSLLTGDHVMGWSTTVVVPPDGDMRAYFDSLEKLRQREDAIYFPAHGPPVEKPQRLVRHLIGHRMQRERQILKRLEAGDREIETIVLNCYPGLDPRLRPAAGGSVLAHLVDLEQRGLVRKEDEQWMPANES